MFLKGDVMPVKRDWSSLQKNIEEKSKKKDYTEPNIYKPVLDKDGCAKVIMRFIDSVDTDMPFVEYRQHYFGGVGGWCITGCTSNIGEGKCPICQSLGSSGLFDSDKEEYSKRKKKTYYYSNVLIIRDDNTPENNGKVMVFKFGVKIYDKLFDAIKSGNNNKNKDGVPEGIPYDNDTGVNFIFVQKKGGNGMPNYDGSYFSDATTPLSKWGDEDKIMKSRHKLSVYVNTDDDTRYVDADTMLKKYTKAIGEDIGTKTITGAKEPTRKKFIDEDDSDEDFLPPTTKNNVVVGDSDFSSDIDDDDDFFNELE